MDAFFKEFKDLEITLSTGKIVPRDVDSLEVRKDSLYISYISTITRKSVFDGKLFSYREKALAGELTAADFARLNDELTGFTGEAYKEKTFEAFARVRSFSLLAAQVLFVDNSIKEGLWDVIEPGSKERVMEGLSNCIRRFSEEKKQPGEQSLSGKEVEFYAVLFTLQAAFDDFFLPADDVVQYRKPYGRCNGSYDITGSYEKATLYLSLVNKQTAVGCDALKELCRNITNGWGTQIDRETWDKMNQYYYEGLSFLTGKENFFATNYEEMLERFLPQFALSKLKCAEEILSREYNKYDLEPLKIIEIGAGSGSFAVDLLMACLRLGIDTSQVIYHGLEPNGEMINKLDENLFQKTGIREFPPGWQLKQGGVESFTQNPGNFCGGTDPVVVFSYSAHHCHYKSLEDFFTNEDVKKEARCVYVLDVVEEHGWTKPFYTWADCESPENFDNVVQKGDWDAHTLWQEPDRPVEGYALTNAWCSLRKLTVRPAPKSIAVEESYIPLKDGITLFLRHNLLKEGKKTLLLVHGLGESGLCFKEIFDHERFDEFNLLVPDMPGYGRSSGAADYGFDVQVERLEELIDYINAGTPLGQLVVGGHSLGGDLTTLFCKKYADKYNIKQYINIEGDISPHELFLSGQAHDAYHKGNETGFLQWFDKFADSDVYYDFADKFGESLRRYYASLKFCRPPAFLQNALELCERNRDYPHETIKSEIGFHFVALAKKINCIFCFGTKSLNPDTIRFIERHKIRSEAFEGAGHWLMVDRKKEFYDFLFNRLCLR